MELAGKIGKHQPDPGVAIPDLQHLPKQTEPSRIVTPLVGVAAVLNKSGEKAGFTYG